MGAAIAASNGAGGFGGGGGMYVGLGRILRGGLREARMEPATWSPFRARTHVVMESLKLADSGSLRSLITVFDFNLYQQRWITDTVDTETTMVMAVWTRVQPVQCTCYGTYATIFLPVS